MRIDSNAEKEKALQLRYLSMFLQGVCHLDQLEGEILLLPRHWPHQVLNLADSVGFAVEILDYT